MQVYNLILTKGNDALQLGR